jgi:opacity protein-like surface antigen
VSGGSDKRVDLWPGNGGRYPLKAPPKAAWGDSWAGFYFGVYFGAGAGRATESFTENRTSLSGTTSPGFSQTSTQSQSSAANLAGDVTGSMVDLFAGYNWRIGNFVVGGQAEGTVFSDVALKTLGISNLTTLGVTTTVAGGVTTTATTTISGSGTVERNDQLRSNFGLIGRAGYLVTPDILLYGLGGLALGNFVYPDGRDIVGGKNSKWVAGYTAGAGGEVRLNDNWSLRAEYRYLHFDVERNEAIAGSQAQVQGTNTNVSAGSVAGARQTSADFHLGKVGVVYRFGPGGPASAMAAIPASLASSDSWAGFYFGAYFGAGAGDAKERFTSSSTFSQSFAAPGGLGAFTQTSASPQVGSGNSAGDMTGSMVDLFAGYNWRIGNFVVGGQVEGTVFSDVSLKTIGVAQNAGSSLQTTTVGGVTTTVTGTFSTIGATERNDQLRSNFGMIGRAGFLATPNVLLYGLGGLALGNFTYPDGGDFGGGKNSKWVAGYTAGAGGEVKLTDNWSLRAEYRYLHFDVKRGETSTTSSTTVQGTTTSGFTNTFTGARQTGADFHLGKVGVVYKFGSGGPASAMAAIPASFATDDSWAGYYFGVYFGAGAGHATESFTTAQSSGTRNTNPGSTFTSVGSRSTAGNAAGDMTGSMADLFAGHNWRFGNVVVGGQLEGTVFSDVSLKTIGVSSFTNLNVATQIAGGVTTTTSTTSSTGTVERNDQLRSNFGAIARVGYLVTPDVLLYGLGGLALGNFVYPDNNDRFGGKNSKWVAGYTAGAGGEMKLTDNWSLRAEYRYLHFDVKRNEANSAVDAETSGTTSFTSASNQETARRTAADFHLGKVGVVYKFGAGPMSAMAAMPARAPRADCCDSWAGLYFGAYFGAGAGRAKGDFTGSFTSVQRTVTPTQILTSTSSNPDAGNLAGDMTGSTVELFAGHNWRFGSFVVGGQVEGTLFSDVSLKTTGVGNPTGTFVTSTTVGGVTTTATTTSAGFDSVEYRERLRSNFGVIARAGYLVTPDVLLYGLGGLALGNFVLVEDNESFTGKNNKWVAGYTAGAGGEMKLSNNWSLRAEYRYLHFDVKRNHDSFNSQTNVTGVTTSTSSDSFADARHADAQFHVGKIGVVYKFCPGCR